jgi:hypothetical protein
MTELERKMIEALKAALPHVERLASFAPTTNANMGKVMQARKDRDLIKAALAEAERA